MIFAFQEEASLYADLAHFPLERSPNGRFMRLFVFADLMVVAAE